MCSILLEYGFSPSIPRPLQNILSNQPELPKRIFYNHLTKRQLPKIGMLDPLLQFAAGIGFIRNMPPRLRNRQRFGSTNNICHTSVSQDCCGKQKHLLIWEVFLLAYLPRLSKKNFDKLQFPPLTSISEFGVLFIELNLVTADGNYSLSACSHSSILFCSHLRRKCQNL